MSYQSRRPPESHTLLKIALYVVLGCIGAVAWGNFRTLTNAQMAWLAIIAAVTTGLYMLVTHLEGKLTTRDRLLAVALIVTLLMASAILAMKASS